MDQSSVSKAQVFLTNRFICIFTGAQILDTAASFLPYNSIIASAKYAVKNIHIQKKTGLAVLLTIHMLELPSVPLHSPFI